MISGSEHAFTFKTLADAFVLRNHVIERFERADVETDPRRKRQLLTFAIIGGGLVGVELCGELTPLEDIPSEKCPTPWKPTIRAPTSGLPSQTCLPCVVSWQPLQVAMAASTSSEEEAPSPS
jgi:hypothetical protein